MGSNGLTSARHDVFAPYLATRYPDSFDTTLSYGLVYSGSLKLTDPVSGLNTDTGKLVLSPTRTYTPVVKKVLEAMRPAIHGMVHCSGGGQTKVMRFVRNMHVVKDNLFPVPPLFRIIHEQSETKWREMYKVFNMGHRFEIYTEEKNAGEIIKIASGFNLEARIVGHCEKSDSNKLTIATTEGTFIY